MELTMDGMQRYLVEEELEHYRDGWITRREFIGRAALIGVGAATAAAMARSVSPPSVVSAAPPAHLSPFHVPEGEVTVAEERTWYPAADGVMLYAYLAWPAGGGQALPGAVVCHANQGLDPHYEDVARRFAKQGYVAIAPDLVSRTGTRASEMTGDERRAAYAALDEAQSPRDLMSAQEFLASRPSVDGSRIAATGFCAGGDNVWRLGTISPSLRAAAPFYGGNPPLTDVSNIRAAIFGIYGGLDTRLNEGIPAVEAAMRAAGTTYRITVYPDSPHSFHNDSSPRSYNPTTGPQAWIDTLNWFAEHLGLAAPDVTMMS